jgi:hypothetical protein
MIGDEWTANQKETLMIGMASMGVHLMQLGLGANGESSTFYNNFPSGIGGHCQWSQIPMDMAILASADAPTSNLYKLSPSNMLLQAFELDATLLARLSPHNSENEPFTYRERPVLSTDTVSTPNTVTVNMALGGENFRITVSSNLRMKSTDGTVSSLLADPLNTGLITTATTAIPVNDATGFDGKTVYIEIADPYQVGDYLWLNRDWRVDFGQFITELRGAYSVTNNQWGAWSLFALAAGLGDSQRVPGIRWSEGRAAGWRDQTPPFETNWSEEFWTDHADTIFNATIGKLY